MAENVQPVAEADDVVVEPEVMVAMRDGVRLRTHVYRPAGGGPFPTLVTRTPYVGADTLDPQTRGIVAQGYAVVRQHSRGRYGSEGTFYPFHIEVDDGYDTIEWAAAQPWSTGKVGTFGASYGGAQQWCAATARPPHLVAMAPTSSGWSFVGGTNARYWDTGVLGLGLALQWSAQMTTWEAERAGVPSPLPAFAQSEEAMKVLATNPAALREAGVASGRVLKELLARRPLRDIDELQELAPWWRDWCDHDHKTDPYWQEIQASDHIDALTMPIFHTAGWFDFFTNVGIEAFTTLRQRGVTQEVRNSQRLEVGPWSHVPGVQPRPDLPSDLPAMGSMHAGSGVMEFFRVHLKGEDSELLEGAPVRIFVMGANQWRSEWEWPLARTEWTPYYLHSAGAANTLEGDGSLGAEPPDDEPADSFVYDPADPVPSPLAVGAPPGRRATPLAVGSRADVLVYRTPPLQRDMEVSGPITLELWVSSSVADTDFTAKLIDVLPDGELVPLCQGMVRTRNVIDSMVPEGIYAFKIDLWATSNMFQAGHRIGLYVSSSEFPTYELNPNTGVRITHDLSGDTAVATQLVHHDATHASRLILPIIPA